jgi:hypothetical protein
MRKYPITLRLKQGVTLDKVIDAVNNLLTYYMNTRARRFDGVNCPLCHLFECDFSRDCLWFIFHHMNCDDFAEKKFDNDVASLKKNKEWRAFRVKELLYWLRELERPNVKIIYV